ncbi:UNKNOWN [Stylonychia lemnae]|uniref:Uncharacterized protein n=1 Tax=Stylonychia lemnae TaxID=5949 RepID=A0A078AS46_STYLE|nr:UNKNOWN [Stylonychia lemnae]|eukprot:CDW84791.1 UNKNOWN [Stylonychia lemnae]
MNTSPKRVMLKLRNRTLNRFKASKIERREQKTKLIGKRFRVFVSIENGKRTLRILPFSGRLPKLATQSEKPVLAQKPSSPIKTVSPISKISLRKQSQLIGTSQMYLRNRNLMQQFRAIAVNA